MDWNAILIALRDFFSARDGRAMVAACAVMTATGKTPPDRASGLPQAADELEYAFNRLFVGPGVVVAPPYASVYLDPDCRLMGESTRRAAAVYDALGLSSSFDEELPYDHLALELDAVLAFRVLGAQDQSAELDALWHYFLHDHLACWLPLFTAKVMQAPAPLHPEISRAIAFLSAWLAAAIKDLPQESLPMTHQPGGTAA
ncbi:molecular chaperone TorD family protein [Telmatospirillum sp.]|uniref:TorD/DmsD family molecular chaperone n=1 Tax=Telmatospirillum sp. TaxID=2079197 RepID=UPI00284515BE|nr:molecular chaperone TorD family protein [Telmatospirillum sp.]MDR3438711.1 molecular chaperone TorD family protein [Telmatospirillum sp.]